MSTYYFLPTRNVFGENSVQEAGVLAKTLNVKKILIVTDAFLAKNGMADKVAAIYKDAGIDVHILAAQNPTRLIKMWKKASPVIANMDVTPLFLWVAVLLTIAQKALGCLQQMVAIFVTTKGLINPKTT